MQRTGCWAAGFAFVGMIGLNAASAPAAVTFNFIYQDAAGQGFFDATQGQARRDALAAVGQQLGGLLNHTATIDIAVQPSVNSAGVGFLATAGTSLNAFGGQAGFIRGTVAQKIINNEDLNGSSADGQMQWNFGHNIYTGSSTSVPFNSWDFRSIALHELTHALGFSALVDQSGNGWDVGNSAGGHLYLTFDSFLENGSGVKLINPATNRYNASASLSDMTSGQVFFDGAFARAANGGNPVEMYTPAPYEPGSSISHLNNFGTVMDPGIFNGTALRSYSPVEIGILQDLGYVFVPEPGSLALLALAPLALMRRRRREAAVA